MSGWANNSGRMPLGLCAAYNSFFLYPEIAALLHEVADRRNERERCEAFAMSQHERLGAESLFPGLEEGVLRIILDQL